MPNLQTCDAFRKRWNNCKCCARKAERDEEYKQMYLYEHFLQEDHHGLSNDGQRVVLDENL